MYITVHKQSRLKSIIVMTNRVITFDMCVSVPHEKKTNRKEDTSTNVDKLSFKIARRQPKRSADRRPT